MTTIQHERIVGKRFSYHYRAKNIFYIWAIWLQKYKAQGCPIIKNQHQAFNSNSQGFESNSQLLSLLDVEPNVYPRR